MMTNPFDMLGSDEMTAVGLVLILLLVYLAILGIGIITYVLQSLAMYTIADRRRIPNAWLAWLPFGNVWILGSIVDHQEGQRGVDRKWRRLLLTLNLVYSFGFVLAYVGVLVAAMILALTEGMSGGDEDMFASMCGILVAFYIALILVVVVSTAAAALQYICIYKLYEELVPEKAIKYFLISLLVPLGQAICLTKCKNSTVGVPQPAMTYAPAMRYQPVVPETPVIPAVPEVPTEPEIPAEPEVPTEPETPVDPE